MEDALTGLLITAIILVIILGIVYVILKTSRHDSRSATS